MDHHQEVVAIIAANVRQFHDRKEGFRIYHGSTNSTRQTSFHRDNMIDISHLTHIIKIDTASKHALVEPTLKHGLIPPVVMEFPGITVGGGFAGTSGESSSFKHGFFENTVNWIEIILANGKTMNVSETENADLFYGATGSFGTLGVTTLLELRLIEAKDYVELTYHPVTSVPAAVKELEELMSKPSIDYLDGIIFSLTSGTVMSGHLTDAPSPNCTRIQRFSRPQDPWFYLHASSLTRFSPTIPVTEAIPLKDYLFRYDRGAFWTGVYAFKYFLAPFNRLTRYLLDYFMHTRVMYHAMHASGFSNRYIIQDLALPASNAHEFIEYVDRDFGIYPLWLCPLRKNNTISFSPRSAIVSPTTSKTTAALLNIGVWGPGPSSPSDFVEANRALERKVKELGGMKWLYAHAYYTEEEFWEMYDRGWYEALRRKYDATTLPSVWEKVRAKSNDRENEGWKGWVKGIWPVRGLWGVWCVLKGSDYLVQKT